MARWKRCGVVVVQYKGDHEPIHVHVFEDGKRLLKFDVESWRILMGRMTSKAKKALERLRKEGKI